MAEVLTLGSKTIINTIAKVKLTERYCHAFANALSVSCKRNSRFNNRK